MNTDEKIHALRKKMKDHGIDALIIPGADPHQSEYVAEHWKIRTWISGFTGSAGTLVVTRNFAGLWVDSRYFIQAEKELSGSCIEMVKMPIPHFPCHYEWLHENLHEGGSIGIDGRLISLNTYKEMEKEFVCNGISITTEINLADQIWKDRPGLPKAPIFIHELRYHGKSRTEKLREIRKEMNVKKCEYHLLTTLDDMAYLLNLRGNDVPFNPVFLGYLLISIDNAVLFAEPEKINEKIRTELQRDGVEIRPYEAIENALMAIPIQSKILVDPNKVNYAFTRHFSPACRLVEEMNPSTLMKAQKNTTEIANLRNVMVKDGVALVKFYQWLEDTLPHEKITETSASNKLHEFRKEQEGFVGDSFQTISAYGPHAALPHYAPDKEEETVLKSTGIYLLDSGGQYYDGTTDTTRTISLGDATDQQKRDFTLVLKGNIALSTQRFPEGTKGYQLDSFARKALWEHGLNYGHGTGHGVGYFLNVHEGPQTIGTSASGNLLTPMLPGMVTSNEPGLYREGYYGIRIENLLLTVPDTKTEFGIFLAFEELTLCPIDKNLVDISLLTKKEIEWLNTYHQKVFRELSPFLTEKEITWLKDKTAPFK